MRARKSWPGFVVVLLLLLVCPAAARAAVNCTVSTTSINFGTTYNVFSPTATDSVATITYSCAGSPFPNEGVAIRITLSAGHSGNFLDRTFIGPDRFQYNLYQDPNRTLVWGDTISYDVDVVIAKSDRGTVFTRTVYGRVPALQDVTSGSYSDTITVSVIY